ncbi:MAG: MFS transporter [Rickettsiales bacterium]|jgi:MFS family permease|nr:MFS transporter [Rickettsiales bacterium]
MASDKYLSMKSSVSGFSFANLGFFYGLGSAIIATVYSLVLFDILGGTAWVGIYNSLSYGFVMILALLTGEFFRRFTKTRIFYYAMFAAGSIAFLMGFSVKPITFIILDQLSWLPWLLIMYCIPLFLTDFCKKVGLEKLSGRYYTWQNIGTLVAPIIAMFAATHFGNRSAYLIASAIMFAGLAYFNSYRVVSADKPIKKIIPRKTLRSMKNNVKSYFARPALTRAYLINCGYYAVYIVANIYAPILIIDQYGFSKTALGLILAACIIPYILLASPITNLSKKIGKKAIIVTGFFAYAVCAFFATFANGPMFVALLLLSNTAMATLEPVRDLLFFDATNRADASRFIGIFNGGDNVPKFIIPMICAGVIFLTGGWTSAVWLVSCVCAVATGVIMLLPLKTYK